MSKSDDERRANQGRAETDGEAGADANAPGTGKVAGIPYDWRKPTAARLKSRWWNADDHRVFTPKTYGWGYDLNLYEVGRRLRLIRR